MVNSGGRTKGYTVPSPIAQSQATWDHLQTRLGEIARAILEEI